jgi:peptidoglycan/LPS O-acetylase OafA/YrhL
VAPFRGQGGYATPRAIDSPVTSGAFSGTVLNVAHTGLLFLYYHVTVTEDLSGDELLDYPHVQSSVIPVQAHGVPQPPSISISNNRNVDPISPGPVTLQRCFENTGTFEPPVYKPCENGYMSESEANATSIPAPKILPLTSVRFFAALFVVVYHGWPGVHSHVGGLDFTTRLIGLGYVSVSFFFMLSGFILAVVYLNSGKSLDKRRFFVSRFARIYPIYLTAILVDLPHFLHTQQSGSYSFSNTLAKLASSLGLVQAWSPALQGLDIPSWSLSAEAFFYLLFPILGAFISDFSIGILLPSSIFLYGAGLWLVHSLGGSHQTYSPFPHLFIFILGINLAQVFRWLNRSARRTLFYRNAAPWALLFSLIAFLAIPYYMLPVSESLMQHGLLAPLFAITVLALASGNRFIARVFSSRWLVILGESSFALYLLHGPIATILRRPMEHYGKNMFLAYLALSIGLSVLSSEFIEAPSRLWILRQHSIRSLETKVSSALMQ